MSQPIQISLCEWSAGVAYRDAILHPAAIFAQKKNTVKICSRSTSSGPDRTNGRKSSFVQGLFVLTGQDERPANEPYRSKQVIVSKRRRSVWVMVRDRPFLLFVRLGGKHGSGLKRDARANGTNRLPPQGQLQVQRFWSPHLAAATNFVLTRRSRRKDPAMQRVMVRRDACRTRSSADHQDGGGHRPVLLGGQAKGSLQPRDFVHPTLLPSRSARFDTKSDDAFFALTGPRRLKKPAGVSASWTAATFPATNTLYAQR